MYLLPSGVLGEKFESEIGFFYVGRGVSSTETFRQDDTLHDKGFEIERACVAIEDKRLCLRTFGGITNGGVCLT